jgi:hypothetical protein
MAIIHDQVCGLVEAAEGALRVRKDGEKRREDGGGERLRLGLRKSEPSGALSLSFLCPTRALLLGLTTTCRPSLVMTEMVPVLCEDGGNMARQRR